MPGADRVAANGRRAGGRVQKPSVPGTWDAYVKRVREDRSGAFAYLVRRGFSALRHSRRTGACLFWLKKTAKRAHAVLALRDAAFNAHEHCRRQRRADAWLKRRVARAKRHRETRADAYRFLTLRARLANQRADQLNKGRASGARAWELHFRREEAYQYLSRRGYKCLHLNEELMAGHEFLSGIGSNAVATTVIRQIARVWLAAEAARYDRPASNSLPVFGFLLRRSYARRKRARMLVAPPSFLRPEKKRARRDAGEARTNALVPTPGGSEREPDATLETRAASRRWRSERANARRPRRARN